MLEKFKKYLKARIESKKGLEKTFVEGQRYDIAHNTKTERWEDEFLLYLLENEKAFEESYGVYVKEDK